MASSISLKCKLHSVRKLNMAPAVAAIKIKNNSMIDFIGGAKFLLHFAVRIPINVLLFQTAISKPDFKKTFYLN